MTQGLSTDYGKDIKTAVELIDDMIATNEARVMGDVAHDAADSGNPFKMGAKAIDHGTDPTEVGANDRTDLFASRQGIPWFIGGHPNMLFQEYRADTAQTNDQIISAVGANTRIILTHITVTADNANTVDVKVRIGFGTASVPTEPADGAAVAGVVLSHPGIAAGSGVSIGNGGGIIAVGGKDEELRITNEVPTGGGIRVVVSFYSIDEV